MSSGRATSVATIADELVVTRTRARAMNSVVVLSDEISSPSEISSFADDEAGPPPIFQTNDILNAARSIPPSQDNPVGKGMTAAEVVSYLVARGCLNRMRDLDPTSFSEHPVFHGGFSDIYSGRLLNNTQVAIKALRISLGNINQSTKHIKCLQICDGLSYLHRIGIIHGDLKGANVLVSDSGVPVLADFGNSILRNQTLKFTQTTSGASLTVRWSAAELITESGPPNEATDVYALGMTIYEVMAGIIPYEGKKEARVIYLVVAKKEPPQRPKSIPEGCEDGERLWSLLVWCWSFESSSRPTAEEAKKIKSIFMGVGTHDI
ncbi:hypothetical protein FRC11_008846 [Ceratobasidium sp. 423]|nr:hypothetical protein FRC11_008846 [Ceratobasidium sp. 423]